MRRFPVLLRTAFGPGKTLVHSIVLTFVTGIEVVERGVGRDSRRPIQYDVPICIQLTYAIIRKSSILSDIVRSERFQQARAFRCF